MGVDYFDQDSAIQELRNLSGHGKAYLSHHIRNELVKIRRGLETDRPELVYRALAHIVKDLENIGC